MTVITLLINEDYGYRYWLAVLSKCEYDELIAKWQTMRALTSRVPVDFLIPQARRIDLEEESAVRRRPHLNGFISDWTDSWLPGAGGYVIPPPEPEDNWDRFYWDGKWWVSTHQGNGVFTWEPEDT